MTKAGFAAWSLAGLLTGGAAFAGELIIAADRRSDYQIVVPDETTNPIISKALADAAGVMREMFQSNGCTVSVVKESQADKQKPGIYFGDTAAARAAGVEASKLPVWTYVWKTAGRNVIIAGRDWAAAEIKDTGYTPCSHGTVKGMTDFMRQFCGTRFLAPGGLVGIEFLPTAKIAVPDDLNLRKDPMVQYNCNQYRAGDATADIAEIGLSFLDNATARFLSHTHELAVPWETYGEAHPEYFAMVNGKRLREEPHLCYSNKDVQELIYQEMLRSFDAGYSDYVSLQADGFRPCQCDECKKMYDTADWGEKLWLLNKSWAERLLKDRPGKTVTVNAYGPTGKPPAAFKVFPPNMRVSVGGYPEAFKRWEGYTVSCGFVSCLHGWGGYHLCGYLPVRTPLYSEKVVKMYETYNVKGIGLDSGPAMMWGLEGPAVYVYSRMLDDVKTNTALKLVDEYIQAAYGKAAPPMTRFFDELHHTLEIYAEVFGVDNGTFQTYQRADGREVRYLTRATKLRLIGFLYPPETLTLLESHLAQAEKTPGLSDKNKLRLALARREFDYLKSTARVVHMYNAYLTQPGKNTLDQLLTEMEAREKMIMSWYDTSKKYERRPGIYFQQPIAPNWPMYIGGPGYYNDHLLRNGGGYLAEPVPPFTWNIAEMRKAPMFGPQKITAKKSDAALSLASEQWNKIPAEKLGPLSLGAAAPKWTSEVKVAYDSTALYVRFEGQLPEGWVKPPEMKRDDEQIVNRESFGAVLAPDNNPARYYRFAGGVTNTARYDARQGFVEDSIDPRFNQDDLTWNPEWRYECAVAADAKSWTALLVIPYQSVGAPTPSPGNEWKVNFGRVHQIRPGFRREDSLWSSNPGTASIGDRKAFGSLIFE